MRRIDADAAEWILGLLTRPERAVSTLGDLVEQAETRGVTWFWLGVLRTAASFLWREVAANPARVTGVAFIGLIVDVAASLVLAGLSGILFFIAAWSGHQVQLNSTWWTIGLDAPTIMMSFWIGRLLARWAPGQESGWAFPVCLGISLSDAAQRIPVLAGGV